MPVASIGCLQPGFHKILLAFHDKYVATMKLPKCFVATLLKHFRSFSNGRRTTLLSGQQWRLHKHVNWCKRYACRCHFGFSILCTHNTNTLDPRLSELLYANTQIIRTACFNRYVIKNCINFFVVLPYMAIFCHMYCTASSNYFVHEAAS